jgi:hypothetical protein
MSLLAVVPVIWRSPALYPPSGTDVSGLRIFPKLRGQPQVRVKDHQAYRFLSFDWRSGKDIPIIVPAQTLRAATGLRPKSSQALASGVRGHENPN